MSMSAKFGSAKSVDLLNTVPTWTWLVTFLASFILALCIRLPFFGQIPAGLNRDEAALGYNAYSLLKTGADEYGQAWPISVTSFGDQKLPGYVYSLIPVIGVLGLTIQAIRLPSLLAGLLLVIELGILARQIARRLDWSDRTAWWLTTITMVFVAVAPWANHFSRVAYEANLALAFFVGGLVVYHWVLDWSTAEKTIGKAAQSRWQERLLWCAVASLWSVTLLTYHSYHIFVPLFVLALIVIDRRQLLKVDRWGLALGAAIAAGIISLLIIGGVMKANLIKSRGISPFRATVIAAQYVSFRGILPQVDSWYGRVLFNKVTEIATILSQNYVTALSGSFFFVQGSTHGDNNPGKMNNFHMYILPLAGLGLLLLWRQRSRATIQRLAAWIFLGIVPAALTITPQHEVRLLAIFPAIVMLAALGLTAVLMTFKTQQRAGFRWGVIVGVTGIVAITTLRMCLQYELIIPAQALTHEKDHLLAQAIIKYKTPEARLVTNAQSSSPYIWYLFESKYDPVIYRNQVERYQPDVEGFIHVHRIDNVYFQTIDWTEIKQWASVQPVVLLLPQKDLPDDKQRAVGMTHLEDIVTRDGKVAYEIWRWDLRGVKEK